MPSKFHVEGRGQMAGDEGFSKDFQELVRNANSWTYSRPGESETLDGAWQSLCLQQAFQVILTPTAIT